jgi:hypothetical protein
MNPSTPNDPPEKGISAATWVGVTVVLLLWNGLTAFQANPFTFLDGYDATFYQLLVRNRLRGHYEVGDQAHTVRTEGRHPMWRPGLVWVEDILARCLGSVSAGSAAGATLGNTLMELALLWLAWRCLGRAVFYAVFLVLFIPLRVNVEFILLTVREGPEAWAAAGLLGGLVALMEALRRRSWAWAVVAGVSAGMSEWFRTGNSVLVVVPFAVYALACLRCHEWGNCGRIATALVVFGVTVALCGRVVPSRANKAVANMWDNLVEYQGLEHTHTSADGTQAVYHVGGLKIVPGTQETYYDYIVRNSDTSTRAYFTEHADEILPMYGERLGEVVTGLASGLRTTTGELVFFGFLAMIFLSLTRPDASTVHVLAFAAGALAHFLGPVVLLRGNGASHYLMVAAPLFLVVGVASYVRLGQMAWDWLKGSRPGLAGQLWTARRAIFGLVLLPVTYLSVGTYSTVLAYFGQTKEWAADELQTLDSLHLEGRKVACRNLSWFIERDIQAVLLPYATVGELEKYARAHKIDGILLWDHEPSTFFQTTPYGLHKEFDRAMKHSSYFGPVQVSGAWRWYPVREVGYARGGS